MVNRMDRDYQAMFHPFRDESVGKGKGLAKAVGLWVATLGIYPLIAGIKHYRAKQKPQGALNPTEVNTQKIGNRLSTALRKLQEPAPSTIPTQTTSPNPGTTHPELTEKPQVDEAWNAEVTDMIAKAKEGDKNALFQLLVWQSEKRNLGGLDLVEGQNPEAIIDDAAAIGNPLAISWKISGLEYNKRMAIFKGQSTEAITEQINTLHTQLEQIAAEGNVEAQRLLYGQPSVEEPKKVETEPQKESSLVDAQFSIEIREMPGMPERAWIQVSGPCPPEKAFEVVRLIARSIGPEFKYMELKEEGSIAVDAGGPRRQFFTKLLEDLITNPPGAKYFNTDESGLPIPILPEDPEAVALFEDLGKVFGLCAKYNVIVGPLFHRVAFELMAKINEDPFFSNDIGSYDFGEAGTLERFYPLYEEIETHSKSGQEFLRQVNLVKSKEEKSDDDKELLADLPEFVKKRMLPLLAISKGLKTHYPVDSKTADNILGMPLNKEKIITQLQFKFLPKEKEEWVKNWVLNASPEDLEKFLFTITGAKAISPNHSIIFRSDPESNNIETDTCYRTWTMNFDAFDTEEELHSTLSGVISYERGFELR